MTHVKKQKKKPKVGEKINVKKSIIQNCSNNAMFRPTSKNCEEKADLDNDRSVFLQNS